MKRTHSAVALTIAGSDSGGGAGVQADLNTFASLGVHGTTAITCLTAQNPRGVFGLEAASPKLVRQQLAAVFAEFAPQACKTGMLYSAGIIEVVAEFFRARKLRRPSLIVDPVMVATSGAALLKPSAVRALTDQLLPLATLVTPNLDEAERLTDQRIHNLEDLRRAARQIHDAYGCAVLVKGGHLRKSREAIDIFYDGRREVRLSAPFVRGVSTHGTGCTYSAAIAAWCARGRSLPEAVRRAKHFISQAIRRSRQIGPHQVLNWAAASAGSKT